MEGTVKLDKAGGYVASQMWDVVSKSIAYSSQLMKGLFDTLGLAEDEVSPFCREFSSLEDLKDAYIAYLPRTFKYEETSGSSNVEPGGDDVAESVDPVGPTHEEVVDRIRRFAEKMAGDGEVDENDDDELTPPPVIDEVAATSTIALPTVNSQELMNHFRAIVQITNTDNLLDKVLAASSCLEGKDNIQGAVSLVRKAKSLVDRWLARPLKTTTEDGISSAPGDSLIERDVIILANVKIGRGASASTVTKPYRVVDVYDKHFNKWFMSKARNPVKNWKKEDKKFKLKIRMLEKNAINEYCDTPLHGSEYSKESICRIIEDCMIVDVVGKLQNIA